MIERVAWIGSKQLGLRALRTMHELAPSKVCGAVTIDDRDDARTMYDAINDYCRDNGIPLFVVANRRELKATLEMLKPEICVVVCWYWIVDKETLSMVSKGFLGVHNSLLPKYRGGAALSWQIMNGEQHAGYSVFSLAEDMDAGDIWQQEAVVIEETDYIADILEKLETKFTAWFTNNYHRILAEEIKPKPQDHSKATYCAQRYPFDGRINWSKSAREIYNYIRAQSEPYPGAFANYNGRKMIIWTAHLSDLTYYGTPGQVARIGQDGVYVICGDNRPIVVDTVQLEGEPKKSSIEVIKSIRVRF